MALQSRRRRARWFGLGARLPTLLALTVPQTVRFQPFTLVQRVTVAVVLALTPVAVGLPFLVAGGLLARRSDGKSRDDSL